MIKITEFPEIPDEIKEASNKKKLAIFIGAGISRFLGCESWATLAYNLTKRCEKEGLINHLEQQSLSNLTDFKKIITICYEILKDDDLAFMDEMQKSLNDGKVSKDNSDLEIYKNLFSFNGLFVTTNADRHIDQLFIKDNIVKDLKDFYPDNASKDKLYKIHGCITDKESLVFTVDRYIEQYLNKNFSDFLQKIFNEYTVLFVGYGLGEIELLDYIFKSKSGGSGHFMLKDYFKHEEKIYRFEQLYFDKLGIKIIPYEKDEHGFNQLKDIIKDWVDKIKIETVTMQKVFEDIDDTLENPNE